MEIKNSWKLVIGVTFGICMLVFGSAFWNNATEDFYNPLNEETYEIDSCLQYMDPPLSSIEDRDKCSQMKLIGTIFIISGIIIIWLTLFLSKDYLLRKK